MKYKIHYTVLLVDFVINFRINIRFANNVKILANIKLCIFLITCFVITLCDILLIPSFVNDVRDYIYIN